MTLLIEPPPSSNFERTKGVIETEHRANQQVLAEAHDHIAAVFQVKGQALDQLRQEQHTAQRRESATLADRIKQSSMESGAAQRELDASLALKAKAAEADQAKFEADLRQREAEHRERMAAMQATELERKERAQRSKAEVGFDRSSKRDKPLRADSDFGEGFGRGFGEDFGRGFGENFGRREVGSSSHSFSGDSDESELPSRPVPNTVLGNCIIS